MRSTKAPAPLVSVITRTKDRPLLLERSILSIHNQTMSDLEQVIVNDGGDIAPIEALLDKHKSLVSGRVKIINNTTSMGMQPAANKAIKGSDSTYVVVHDDDDTWHPTFLEKTTTRLDETDAMGVIAATDFIIEEIQGGKITEIERRPLYPDLEFINLYRMCKENYAAPISFLYRREVYKKLGYYDETMGGVADWDFGLRFLLQFDIEYLNSGAALAFYHHRPQASGIDANSVYTAAHRELENRIMNKYLRNDFASNKLGVGYIMNYLRYDNLFHHSLMNMEQQANSTQFNQLANQVARLEGSIQHQTEIIQARQNSLPVKALRRIRRIRSGSGKS